MCLGRWRWCPGGYVVQPVQQLVDGKAGGAPLRVLLHTWESKLFSHVNGAVRRGTEGRGAVSLGIHAGCFGLDPESTKVSLELHEGGVLGDSSWSLVVRDASSMAILALSSAPLAALAPPGC